LSDSDKKGWSGERRRAERRSGGDRRRGKGPRVLEFASAEANRREGTERRVRERRSGRERRSEAGWAAVEIERGGAANDEASLVAAAVDARTRARAAFSRFRVGAALETADGEVFTGCNIENATYGLTMCAERVALYKALSEGRDRFKRIVVVADTAEPTPPCGSCRQLLWECCGDIEIVIANLSEVKARLSLLGLLPLPFDARLLE
jgi:cytidine deaminase